MGQIRTNIGVCFLRIAALLACSFFVPSYCSPVADQQAGEYEIKSAFLLNFIKFIEWPPVHRGVEPPFAICILGYDPFGRILDQMVNGETADGRRLTVRRISGSLPGTCQVVFAGRHDKGIASALANPVPGVLTVGEGDAFLKDGGMIAFILENRRVRFDINQPAVARAGLRISSKLLSVARYVER
jgi:hypothetical protein